MRAGLVDVIVFSAAGGLVSLVGGVLLLTSQKSTKALEHYAIPFAAGALLATVFLDLLHEGLESGQSNSLMLGTLTGIILFFLLERFLTWFHHHHENTSDHDESHKASMVIIGDTLHNALDGVAIAASFLISFPTGVVTTFAVAAHEIPHEIGDFGVLLSKGLKRRKVLLVNFMSAMATVVLAILTYSLGSKEALPLGWLIGLSAGFLLYIAMSDLIPSIHDKTPKKRLFDWRPTLLILGVLTVGLAINIAHHFLD